MKAYPLRFVPQPQERLWGGTGLRSILKKPFDGSLIGESWEISGLPQASSQIVNGHYCGYSLMQIMEDNGSELLGERLFKRFGTEFPLLIKFIEAQQDLSIQLHPDDHVAIRKHSSKGKTEMWYVLRAEKGATLAAGFDKPYAKTQVMDYIARDDWRNLLKHYEVKAGDAFYIPAGMVHYIGKGILLAEIQQTSDITYRLHDFGRLDTNGKPRQLHIEEGLEAIEFNVPQQAKVIYTNERNHINRMVRSPYFNCDFMALDRNCDMDQKNWDSFIIYICIEGLAKVKWEEGEEQMNPGDTLLIPACLSKWSIVTRNTTLLQVYL